MMRLVITLLLAAGCATQESPPAPGAVPGGEGADVAPEGGESGEPDEIPIDEGEQDPPASLTVGLRDYCVELAAAMCPRLEDCGRASEVAEPLGLGGGAECPARLARVLDGWICERYLDSEAAGRIAWDEGVAGGCVLAVAGADCDDLFGAPGVGLSPPVCEAAVTPRAEDGGACAWSYECAEGLACGIDAASDTPTCAPLAPAGGECAADAACDDGLHCAGDGYDAEAGERVPGACRAPQPGGGPCESADDCEAPLRCAPWRGVCFVARGPADPCELDAHCAPGLYCDDDDACAAPGAVGARCDAGEDCTIGRWCDVTAGLCRAQVEEGQACAAEFACAQGLVCLEGACAPPREEESAPPPSPAGPGDACDRAGQCAPALICEEGICEALPGEGQPCGGEGACAPLTFCDPASALCQLWPADAEACRDDADCAGDQLRCHAQRYCTELPAPELEEEEEGAG